MRQELTISQSPGHTSSRGFLDEAIKMWMYEELVDHAPEYLKIETEDDIFETDALVVNYDRLVKRAAKKFHLRLNCPNSLATVRDWGNKAVDEAQLAEEIPNLWKVKNWIYKELTCNEKDYLLREANSEVKVKYDLLMERTAKRFHLYQMSIKITPAMVRNWVGEAISAKNEANGINSTEP